MAAEQQPVIATDFPEFAAAQTLDIERDDKPQDECGVFGIWAPGQGVIETTIRGMEGLQHRGHSGAGIAYYIENAELPPGKTQKPLMVHKGPGRVRQAIPEVYPPKEATFKGFDFQTDEPVIRTLDDNPWRSYDINVFDKEVGSRVAIGHARYSTAETEDLDALHPHVGKESNFALAHNGHIDNMAEVAWKHGMFDIAANLSAPGEDATPEEKSRRIPTDSETLALVLDRKTAELDGDLVAAMKTVLPDVNGAYCLTVIHNGKLIAARDPWGFHPLALGRIPGTNGIVVSSEQAVFDASPPGKPHIEPVGAEPVRDVEAGEIVVVDEKGIMSYSIERKEDKRLCAYEGIYVAREDGTIDGMVNRLMRYNLGYYLGIDQPVDADIVVPVPASAIPSAEGYAAATELPLVHILEKVKDVRSFLMRADERAQAIVEKYGINQDLLELGWGKRWVLEDDSMIKGSTMRALVAFARQACGAAEVHVRLSSAEFRKACRMGLDTHDEWRLIASRMDTDEMAAHIGADSVAFNTPERVQQAAAEAGLKAGRLLCMSCFTGDYPFPLPQENRVIALPMPQMRRTELEVSLPA